LFTQLIYKSRHFVNLLSIFQTPFNPLSSGPNFVPPQNTLQAPPQIQPAQVPQQPWGNQFPQWTPPTAAAPAPAIPAQNGLNQGD